MPVHLQKNSANVSRRHRLKNAVLGLRKKLWSRWGRFQILFGLWRTFCDKGIPPPPPLGRTYLCLKNLAELGLCPSPPFAESLPQSLCFGPKKVCLAELMGTSPCKRYFWQKNFGGFGRYPTSPPLFFWKNL